MWQASACHIFYCHRPNKSIPLMFYNKQKDMSEEITKAPTGWVKDLLQHIGIPSNILEKFDTIITLAIVAIIAFLAASIIYHITQIIIKRLLLHKKHSLLERMIKYRALQKGAHLIPPIIINSLLPISIADKPVTLRYIEALVWIYFIIALVISITAILNTIGEAAFTNSKYHDRPIKGFLQITKIIIYIIAIIIAISILTNKSPLYLIGGLGAFAAVLMLITKDSIMGFVGGFLLLENDMVRLGDWIEVAGTSINGTVTDISLTIVKVQNFDNTIVTIPPYSLINNSFINWRGMQESGGRRISRGYNIKLDSIKPCDSKFLARLKEISPMLDKFISIKTKQSEEGKIANTANPEGLTNGTIDTNLGLFRAYAEMYLQHHPLISKEMMIMVRTLAPCDTGLPIQFYCFANITEWKNYESIQSEIMEHFAAMLPHFGLYPFQSSGARDTIISGLLEGNFPVEQIAGLPYMTTGK